MKSRIVKIELTAIYLVGAALLVALTALAGRIVYTGGREAYPGLRVSLPTEFVQPEGKTVYFTFDDGPSPNTELILDMLGEQGVKATFFVSAQNADKDYTPVLLRRIVDEGHSLGLHSYSHEYGRIYKSVDSFLEDINKLNDYLDETVGVRPRILRFPGGSATVNCEPEVMKGIIRELTARGYLYYDWDVVSGDDTTTVFAPEYLAQRIVEGVGDKERAVVLLHDSPTPVTSAKAVELAIGQLREQGYAFDRLTERVEPMHLQTTRYTLEE